MRRNERAISGRTSSTGRDEHASIDRASTRYDGFRNAVAGGHSEADTDPFAQPDA